MRFRIRHATTYRYEHPVSLGPHVLRLRPREDAWLRLDSFRVSLYPRALETAVERDAEGNLVISASFEGATQEFRIAVDSVGETVPRVRPVQVADGTASWTLPIDYAAAGGSEPELLAACLRTDDGEGEVAAFVAAVARDAGGGAGPFLETLVARLHAELRDVSRLTGAPFDPEITLRRGEGSCRDFAVLFVACCRRMGIAARFVSGYLPAPPGERQHMHAWAEALLPGAGWVPYDATRGGLAGPEHVPVAAAAEPHDAAPLTGSYAGRSASEMSVELTVEMG